MKQSKILVLTASAVVLLIALAYYFQPTINSIQVSSPHNNILRAEVNVELDKATNIHIKYQAVNDSVTYRSLITEKKKNHSITLLDLKPDTEYSFQVINTGRVLNKTSNTYTFKTAKLPLWLEDYLIPTENYTPDPTPLDGGFVHLYKRKTPGTFVLFDGDWNLRWYHQINGTGIKAATYTANKTFLGILGSDDIRTAYGDEIIEIDILGNEIKRIKLGANDFNKIIHHDILLTPENNVATITLDTLIYDLRPIGGNKNDTIIGDGILILDKQGKRIWKWSVFDVLNPVDDPDILDLKNDWVHANALSYDRDGNFLMSFYNLNQIWKINSQTGKIIWKLGKGGDLTMDSNSYFSNQHSVHINEHGHLMLFDNGTHRNISRALSFSIDEQTKSALTIIDAPLPKKIFSARMGSAYLMKNGNILQCSSKNNAIVITDNLGDVLWQLNPVYLPYRAECIPNVFKHYYTEND